MSHFTWLHSLHCLTHFVFSEAVVRRSFAVVDIVVLVAVCDLGLLCSAVGVEDNLAHQDIWRQKQNIEAIGNAIGEANNMSIRFLFIN